MSRTIGFAVFMAGETIAELTNNFCRADHAETAPKSGLEREFPATLQL
jgi:hypothetical protein